MESPKITPQFSFDSNMNLAIFIIAQTFEFSTIID